MSESETTTSQPQPQPQPPAENAGKKGSGVLGRRALIGAAAVSVCAAGVAPAMARPVNRIGAST